MKNKKVIISAVVGVFVVGLLGYFLFYVPYENQIAYQQNVACSELVTKAEASDETQIAQVVRILNVWLFYPPQSHFNKRLNTCLGYFSNSYTISSNNSATQLYFSRSISDVISNKTIVTSDTEMVLSNTTLVSGVSSDEFNRQEAILMSE